MKMNEFILDRADSLASVYMYKYAVTRAELFANSHYYTHTHTYLFALLELKGIEDIYILKVQDE